MTNLTLIAGRISRLYVRRCYTRFSLIAFDYEGLNASGAHTEARQDSRYSPAVCCSYTPGIIITRMSESILRTLI